MQKFLFHIIIFLTGVLLVNIAIYFGITYPHLYEKYEEELDEVRNYHNFMFSDSHGWRVTFGNEEAKKRFDELGIFNFSYGSDCYCDMLIKFQYLLDHAVAVDTIFLTADDHTLSTKRESNNNGFRSVSYADWQSYHTAYKKSRSEFLFRKYIHRYLPIISKSNQGLIKEFLANTLTPEKKMSSSENTTWATLEEKERVEAAQAKKEDFFPSKGQSSLMDHCLEHILSLAESHNIVILGIKFPLSPTFIKEIQGKSYEADSLIINHGYEIWDFKALFQEETYFSNENHVNQKGGLALTAEIKKHFNIQNK